MWGERSTPAWPRAWLCSQAQQARRPAMSFGAGTVTLVWSQSSVLRY